MPTWRKSDSMPKVRASSGTMDNQFPDFRVAHQLAQHTDENHGRGDFAALAAFEEFAEQFVVLRQLERLGAHGAARDVSAKLLPAGAQILNFRAVFRRAVKGRVGAIVVADGNAE